MALSLIQYVLLSGKCKDRIDESSNTFLGIVPINESSANLTEIILEFLKEPSEIEILL